MTERVKNTGTHAIDLSDGRVLAPGETADDVALGNPHNRDLVDGGFLTSVAEDEKSTDDAEPRTRTKGK